MRVAIIGAGPAGCTAAFELQKRGMRTVIFESASQIGGRSASTAVNDFHIDHGAGFYRAEDRRVCSYIEQFDLARTAISMPKILQLRDGSDIIEVDVESPRSLLTSSIGKPGRRIWDFVVLGLLSSAHRKLDLSNPATLATFDKQSVSEYFRSQVSCTTFEHFIRPLIEGFWFHSCETTSAALACAFLTTIRGGEYRSLSGGMGSLCRSLSVGSDIRLQSVVKKLLVAPGNSLTVVYATSSARQSTESFDAVVLATPADSAIELTSEVSAPVVSDEQKQFLRAQSYIAISHNAFVVEPPDTLARASLISPVNQHRTKLSAIGLHSQRFPESLALDNRELLSVYNTEEDSGVDAWQRVRSICPELPAQLEPVFSISHRPGMPRQAAGHFKSGRKFDFLQHAPMAFCGDYTSVATVEGAVASGQRAAEVILGKEL